MKHTPFADESLRILSPADRAYFDQRQSTHTYILHSDPMQKYWSRYVNNPSIYDGIYAGGTHEKELNDW